MGMGMGMVACLCLCLCVCAVEQQPPYTAATTAANNSPGRWMNISEEHGEGWGEKGFPELEAKMEKVFELFNNRTFPIYESDIKHGGWKKNGIVVINPHALTYGGFGNLIISAMGVVLYAFSQKRAPVLSHGLVRANDNIEAPFLPDLQQCYVECAARKGLQLEKTLGRKVCIFVTSNRDSLADYIVEHLRSVSSNFAFLAHAYNDTHVEGTKHSISLSKEWKSVDHINSTQLFRQAGDVMDWLLLGEATYSVHTDSGSSFVNSARLRLGPTRLRSVFDPLQLDLVPYVVDGTCVCKERKKSCITGPFR
ncbi:hypothetical protein B484DRAFT_481563 [Ochromonadaceae sp. CCMP2298]|nr:hypothetical protein B484DRAFT_481563 [Ochromonadaceae sp. CCMP2298]